MDSVCNVVFVKLAALVGNLLVRSCCAMAQWSLISIAHSQHLQAAKDDKPSQPDFGFRHKNDVSGSSDRTAL